MTKRLFLTLGCFVLGWGFNPITARGQAPFPSRALLLGPHHLRARLTCSPRAPQTGAPLALVVPGEGPWGPSGSGTPPFFMDSIANELGKAGLHTLQLGKAGVDFPSPDGAIPFYNQALYHSTTWNEALAHVDTALDFVRLMKPCGAGPLVLVGHGEGTTLATHVAKRRGNQVGGLVLLGFVGTSFEHLFRWRLWQRPIDLFLKPDVDGDKDGVISREDAHQWGLHYPWPFGEHQVSFEKMVRYLAGPVSLESRFQELSQNPLYAGVWSVPPLPIAQMPQPVLAFSGDDDVQVLPRQLGALKQACVGFGKTNCQLFTVKRVGHCFSPPAPPRYHPLLDETCTLPHPVFLKHFGAYVKRWSFENFGI